MWTSGGFTRMAALGNRPERGRAPVIHVIRIDELPAGPAGEEGRMRKIITPETVGAKRVGGEQYDLKSGSSSQTFLLDDQRQFFYVLAGQAEARLGEMRQPVRAGHGVYAEPGEACRFEDCGEEGFRFLRFMVPPAPDA